MNHWWASQDCDRLDPLEVQYAVHKSSESDIIRLGLPGGI